MVALVVVASKGTKLLHRRQSVVVTPTRCSQIVVHSLEGAVPESCLLQDSVSTFQVVKVPVSEDSFPHYGSVALSERKTVNLCEYRFLIGKSNRIKCEADACDILGASGKS